MLPNLNRKVITVFRMFSTATEDALVHKEGNVQKVILNRPKALNALNLPMIRKLTPLYKGAGEKAFCAGGDIVAIAKGDEQVQRQFFAEEYVLDYLTHTTKKPQIAILNGITMGGGVGLSVHGKFRVATPTTLFAMPETGIGFFTDVGGSHFLPRLPGFYGMFLGLTGHRLKGREVLDCGIATHYCTDPQALVRPTIQQVQEILDSFSEKRGAFPIPIEQIDACFGLGSVEEILDRLASVNSDWSRKALETMGRMSPTAMKVRAATLKLQVVHRQLTLGKQLNLAECLAMDYRISQRMMKGKDFFEGVRALLIEKDNKPTWKPASLKEISEADGKFSLADPLVAEYFAKLPPQLELDLGTGAKL